MPTDREDRIKLVIGRIVVVIVGVVAYWLVLTAIE